MRLRTAERYSACSLFKTAWCLAAAALLASCAPATAPPVSPAVPPPVPQNEQPASAQTSEAAACARYREQGIASWYGREYEGMKTAGGETFDMNGLTAAHRTLPLGATVRVVNLDNYRTVRVKVNDRGPFARSRVIELSYGAARELGFVETGTARVRIESEEPVTERGAVYTVHAAAFQEEESALALKERLAKKFESVSIDTVETNRGKSFHVRVGSYPTEEKAERVAARLMIEGVEPLVIRKDN